MISKLEDGKFKCLLCLKTFSHLKNAKTHHSEKHTLSTESHACSYCGKSFPIRRYLQVHLSQSHKITQKMLKNLVPTS